MSKDNKSQLFMLFKEKKNNININKYSNENDTQFFISPSEKDDKIHFNYIALSKDINSINKSNLTTSQAFEEEMQVKEILIEEEEQKQKNFGRKRKRDGDGEKHDKYADDNLRRKVKHIILSETMEFINNKIYELYNGDIGKGIVIKKLFILNNNKKSNSIIQNDKIFLDKTLGEIFSEDISTKYTNYPKNHNRIIIEKLINENDYNKRKYFVNLFNLTFLESLKHFRGSIFIEELSGLSNYNQILKQYELEGEYKTFLAFYINYYELIINKKKSRRPKKGRNNEDNDNV